LARGKFNAAPESFREFDYHFGLTGLLESGLNPTAQYVGHYTVNIIPNENGTTQTVIFVNRTSMSSFLYHLTPESWGRPTGSIMGNSFQEYQWVEPLYKSGYPSPAIESHLDPATYVERRVGLDF